MKELETESRRFDTLYNNVKNIIDKARETVYKTANFETIKANWEIGRHIVEEEQHGKERAHYGDALVKNLSEKLTQDYGKGFTTTNLKYMRQFYNYFPKGHALRGELSWTHYRLLFKIEKIDARDFYINETISCNWSTRYLERAINTSLYERLLVSNDKEPVLDEVKKVETYAKPEDYIKDPYVLDFLGLEENTAFQENDLEQAIMDNLQKFLLELGKGFAFVGRQRRFNVDGVNY
jgi:predicted nuclease of restriction endonuclease-like (RecB) superfamily